MQIRNFTPHVVNVINFGNFESEGVIRVQENLVPIRPNGDPIPFVFREFGEVIGLPDQEENVYLIVSTIVQRALPFRNDLVCPADLVRDEKGNIIGCKSLSF